VNCAAFSESLLDSELFGHVRGAFTGATALRVGLIEAAHNGTLFLDEVCSMPTSVQAKLLRTLDSGEVRRLGENGIRVVDARVVAATNWLGGEALPGDQVRSDLLYRLNTYRIHVPPLRERGDDIALLARHFLANHARTDLSFSAEAMHALRAYSYPGNVRELKHAIERAVTFAEGPVVRREHLPIEFVAAGDPAQVPERAADDKRKLCVLAALKRHEGRIEPTARDLGVSRTTLWRLMHKYHVGRAGN
jgi:DNA-binding NtrC family response regulator